MTRSNRVDHIRITSHPAPGAKLNFPIAWGAAGARERGPVIGTVSRPQDRNVIGTHGGSYSVYRALAVSSGALDPIRRPDLTNTHPAETIGPFPQCKDFQSHDACPTLSLNSSPHSTRCHSPPCAQLRTGADDPVLQRLW